MAKSQNINSDISVETTSVKKNKTTWGGPWTEQKLDTFEKYVRAISQ